MELHGPHTDLGE